jgi:hypothetical protein
LTSNNASNTNTLLEANLTQQSESNVASANSQNFLAFGLASGHTQIDGSPITFAGQCGPANTIAITLDSYTWNSSSTQATSNVSLTFGEGAYQFSGTGTGILTPYTTGQLSGTYSSTGACADSGTWTATFSNGNLVAYTPGANSTLPLTAYPNCTAGYWFGATEGGEAITNTSSEQNSLGQTFIVGLWCGNNDMNAEDAFLEYSANGTVVGQVEFGSGQKVYYPQGPHITTGAGTPQVVDTFNWFVFGQINGTALNLSQQLQVTIYAYNPDGTFVTDFNGTCADAPDGTGTNCN